MAGSGMGAPMSCSMISCGTPQVINSPNVVLPLTVYSSLVVDDALLARGLIPRQVLRNGQGQLQHTTVYFSRYAICSV